MYVFKLYEHAIGPASLYGFKLYVLETRLQSFLILTAPTART
jgi:hypothetical protein